MTTPIQPAGTLAVLGMVAFCFATTLASAQTELLAIEFNEDDQEGFELWPEPLRQQVSSTASFTTDPVATTGETTVVVAASTSLSVPANRGALADGSPDGFSFTGLYQDLLHAASPTGFITLDFSGLNPNDAYQFTLYAWDPGATDTSDKVWTITGGSGEPAVASVNFQDPLVDNDSFALVFDITTTATGDFQVTNTAGLPQSAINGFKLVKLGPAAPFEITEIDYSPANEMVTLTWDSREGATYAVKVSTDLTDWEADLDDGVEADPGEQTTRTFDIDGLAKDGALFFRVERQ